MKSFHRPLIVVGIVIALVLLILIGLLLYKHFITDQIRDKDGMVNPNYIIEMEETSVTESTENEATQ